jgi:hypothetical protein
MGYDESSLVASERVVKPLVSVLIPTHNRSDTLPRALDSAYGQEGRGDHFDLEIIVVDDASSDATPSVIRAYPGIRYIRLPERRGVSAATNVALQVSRGCYITFLDDDDVWLQHKLRVQVPLLTAHPDIGVVYSQSLVRSEGAEERLYPEASKALSGRVFTGMLMDNFCGHHASLLARRTAFEKAGYFDETLTSHVDWDMSLRLAFHVPFLFMPGAVDVYNLSPQGLWLKRAASGMGRADAARVIEKALQLLPNSPQYEEVKRVARARVMLGAVYPLLLAGDLTQVRETVMTTLRAHPWIIRHDWARDILGDAASQLALSTTSPVLTARELCAEIRSATLKRTLRDRWYVRCTFGAIWADTARSLASSDPARDRDSAYAAATAIATMPSFLRRLGLLRLIVRGVLGRRADTICAGWYMRMRNMMGAAARSARAPDLR